MNIPYEIGQPIWKIYTYHYYPTNEDRVEIQKLEISSITIKRSKEIKLRLTNLATKSLHEITEDQLHEGMLNHTYWLCEFAAMNYFNKNFKEYVKVDYEIKH